MSEIEKTGVRGTIEALQSGKATFFSSLPTETFEEKKTAMSIMTNAVSLADSEMLGKPFNLRHVIVQSVDMTDEQTGEVAEQPRILLVTDTGEAYAAISNGLVRSIENLIGMFGSPDSWESSIPVEVVEKRGRSGYRFYTINVL